MNFFIRIFIFLGLLFPLNAQIVLQPCNSAEIRQIEEEISKFLAEEMVQAGIFENIELAKSSIEAHPEEHLSWDDPENEMHYYYLNFLETGGHCGFLCYWIKKKVAYLDAIYLNEDYRGQGLGSQVLQIWENSVREMGIETLRLYVFEHNQQAIKTYKKNGYVIEKTYYFENKLIGHHMSKNLEINCD